IKILAEVVDNKGRKNTSETDFWVLSSDQKSVQNGKLLLLADKASYLPGETAEVSVQSPFSHAHGFVTLYHRGIFENFPIEFSKSSLSFKIKIDSDMIPACTARVDLVGENFAHASERVVIKILPDFKRLKIALSASQNSYEPGSTANLKIHTMNAEGKPVSNTSLAVAVIDESVLALSGYDWEDPCRLFYSDFESLQSASVSASNLRDLVKLPFEKNINGQLIQGLQSSLFGYRRLPNSRTGSVGMGGGKDAIAGPFGSASFRFTKAGATLSNFVRMDYGFPFSESLTSIPNAGFGLVQGLPIFKSSVAHAPLTVRKDFGALAYFDPSLETNSNGVVNCTFKLPDNLTRYRVIVVGATADNDFGKAETSFTSQKPLLIRPSAPRFLNFGDSFNLPLVIQNQTSSDMQVQLAIRSSNLLICERRRSVLRHKIGGLVSVPANDHVEVQIPSSTEHDGNGRLDIVAVSGTATDAAEVIIPVLAPVTQQSFATYGQIEHGAEEQLVEVPEDVCDQ
ncbi:MAG: hypothetical protein K2X81_05820, partial [Candidatus Obscuribacterales bacterium]|nr:hypothetical protein [Candidatus Obscuribacterales bacterium]